MRKYRAFEAVPTLEKIKIGDLLSLSLPDGNIIRGFVAGLLGAEDLSFLTVFFEDGRSYLASPSAEWEACCHFVSAWRPIDPDEETQR